MPDKDHVNRLYAVMNAIAESYTTASDDDLVNEAREAGVDVEAHAQAIQAQMLDAVARHKRARLTAKVLGHRAFESGRELKDAAANLRFEKLEPTTETLAEWRKGFEEGAKCPSCVERRGRDGFAPSHFGSTMCESGSLASGGKRSHCTCDMCW